MHLSVYAHWSIENAWLSLAAVATIATNCYYNNNDNRPGATRQPRVDEFCVGSTLYCRPHMYMCIIKFNNLLHFAV